MLLTRPKKRDPFSAMIALIWSRRRLMLAAIRISLRQRFAGATLGLAWLVLGPLLLLTLYALIYLVVFQIRPDGMEPQTYVLYIFSGLVPIMGFSQGLMQGTVSLSGDRDILLNTVFPAELVPLRDLSTAMVSLTSGLVLTGLLGTVWSKAAWTWLLVPLFLVMMLMLLAGVTWILCLANLIFKDVQQLLTYVVIILMIASPIAYTPDMLPANLRVLIYFNPLAYFVIAFQSLIVLGEIPPPSIIAGTIGFAVGSFLLGSWVFSRTKLVFFDHA